MGIDEARRDDQAGGIDDPAPSAVNVVADFSDPAFNYSNTRLVARAPGSIDYSSVLYQEIVSHFFHRSSMCRGSVVAALLCLVRRFPSRVLQPYALSHD